MTTYFSGAGWWRSDTPITWPGGRLDAPTTPIVGPSEWGYLVVPTGVDPDTVFPYALSSDAVIARVWLGQYDDTDTVTSDPYTFTYVGWKAYEWDGSAFQASSDHDGELYAPDVPAGDLYTYAYPVTPGGVDPGQPTAPTPLTAETPDAIGAAPVNDGIAGAIDIGGAGAGTETVPDIRPATADGGLSYDNVANPVWFRWSPAADSTTATFSTAGSNVTAFLNVWSSPTATATHDDLTLVTNSVDGGDPYHALNDERIVQDAEATVATVDPDLFYYVQAGAFWSKDDASFEVSLTLSYPAGLAPPAVTPIVSMRERTASASFTVLIQPEADTTAPLLKHINITMPTPVLSAAGRPDPADFKATAYSDDDWGRIQVLLGGHDVTRLRGAPTIVQSWSDVEPFGDATAQLFFSGISSFEAVGDSAEAPLNYFAGNPNVELRRIHPDGTVDPDERPLFQGVYASDSATLTARGDGMTAQIMGALFQADLQPHQPAFTRDARDIGHVIADELNSTVGRRFATCARVTTGIMTRKRGSWGPKLSGYIQELLGTALTDDGEQWTVQLDKGRKPKIVLKDSTTFHHTITTGTQGIEIDLQRDRTQATNAIYAEWVTPDQCRGRNTRYPRLRLDDAPDYPFFDPDDTISTGGNNTDAETDSGTGVSDWQREMADQGYTVSEDGVYGTADAAQARELQRRAGLVVDGIVGPQTWNATFEVGSNAGDLGGAFFAPVYELSSTQPWLYAANGARLGPNPDHDPRVIQVARFEEMGEGLTKNDVYLSARNEIARANTVDLNGTIRLTVDPEEGSRWQIRAGENIVLKKYRGVNRLLHISKTEKDPVSGVVTLTVDSQFRDLITLAAVRQRDREATDPARAQQGRKTSSRTQQDERPVWDCENGAGRIPRHAQAAGLWSILRIPAGQAGTVARIRLQSFTSASRFSVALFGRPVTPGDMVRLIGDPLAADGDGGSKWDTASRQEPLRAAGLMIPFGGRKHACGYHPGTDPDSGEEGDHTITGLLDERGGFEYDSAYPPWLWVAIYTQSSCFVEGRLYQSVQGG